MTPSNVKERERLKRFWRELDWLAPLLLASVAAVWGPPWSAAVFGVFAGKALRDEFPRKRRKAEL